MPRKSAASTTAPDTNGDVSMVSEAPEVEAETEQPEEKQRTIKGSKKKERLDRDATAQQLADPVSIDVSSVLVSRRFCHHEEYSANIFCYRTFFYHVQ